MSKFIIPSIIDKVNNNTHLQYIVRYTKINVTNILKPGCHCYGNTDRPEVLIKSLKALHIHVHVWSTA